MMDYPYFFFSSFPNYYVLTPYRIGKSGTHVGNLLQLKIRCQQAFEYRHADAKQNIRYQYEEISFHAARFTRYRCVFCFPHRLPSAWEGRHFQRDNPS